MAKWLRYLMWVPGFFWLFVPWCFTSDADDLANVLIVPHGVYSGAQVSIIICCLL